ncbi:class I SAM-dependent methyltransferase, partial [bacterium]|nr:class I SAM-dependent methyltransferase [bacterium]
MNYVIREKSLLSGENNLEQLYAFKDFPVFMGCVNAPQYKDLAADMSWEICRDTGLIQLKKLLPLDILYLDQHNDGIGKVWQDHYLAFSKFLRKYKPKKVLEIGGAHDHIARNYMEMDSSIKWISVEPNPQYINNKKIKVIKDWFDDKFTLDENVDTIIHSHVFEHTYSPFEFISHIGKFLKIGDKHIFTFPNMLEMLKRKFTNCLNFEHTIFLTEYFTDYILQKQGFKIIEKEYYGDPHSIFYATQKIVSGDNDIILENKYIEYKKIFMNFINYHLDIVNNLNNKIEKSSKSVYLFGGHIFSQYLINFGLKEDRIESILDNSPIKQNKRLYGTSLNVFSPKILKKKDNVV